MAAPAVLLTRFVATRPRYQLTQPKSLAWLAHAHTEAEQLPPLERDAFHARMHRLIDRVACPQSKIGTRGSSINIEEFDHRAGTGARTKLFGEIVDAYFASAYADELDAPDDLVHVTCTGYLSPSGAQKLVAARHWPTRVTHAYQMGCYAAVPAVRIAAGLLTAGKRVDIAHTELCSLHCDPADHSLEQLVVQSLFSDGLIRYSAVRDDGSEGLRLRALHEQIIPDSAEAMSWVVSDHGMHMTLASDVPERIATALRSFVLELLARAHVDPAKLRDCVLAVHPGGPKIIDRVRQVLELGEDQVRTSRGVLFDHGNMSSATLPHIWMRILLDRGIPRGTLIPSLAFGPGLTVCGAVFEKR